VLVDANILLYAVDTEHPHHERAKAWIEEALNGPRRVGIPWVSSIAFVRIATNPRALRQPLTPPDAWSIVTAWLDAPSVWIPEPGPGYREILGDLLARHRVHGNLVSDAALAALSIEHGLEVVSNDSDFARFPEVTWNNPLA
jgi:toxin-antitoxin system PIN domain toxin